MNRWPAFAVAALLAACAVAQPTPATSQQALAQIDTLIGSASCQRDDDCASVGIGELACGGPQAWRAWSRRDTDAAALAQAVDRQRAERRRENERSGVLSVCRVVPDPGVHCSRARPAEAGRCQLNLSPGAGQR